MKKFNQKTLEELKYYVYALFDPRNKKIFYIGKGNGNRIFQHLSYALEFPIPSDKLSIIREIINGGLQVGHYIIRHGLTEETAFIIESCLIDLLTFNDFIELSNITNLVSGHDAWDKGIKTVDEIESLYSAIPIEDSDITHKVIIININKTYRPGTSPYEATRKQWKLNLTRAKKAEYVFSEYRGIIRKIYRPLEWLNAEINTRYEFKGIEITDENILSLYLNKQLVSKKRGQANPIRYFNF